MAISSHITVAIKPEFYKSNMKMGALQPGSTLVLKIVELKGDRALIDFGNFRTTADIKIPVTLGEELTVKVIEAGKQLKLGVINLDPKNSMPREASAQRSETPPAEILNKIQNDVTRILNQAVNSSAGKKTPSSIFNILASLNAYFEPFELKEIISDLLPRLRSHFENSGIFFEKSLEQAITRELQDRDGGTPKNMADLSEVKTIFKRDLKPNLLMLQHLIDDKESLQKIFDPRTMAVMKKAIDTLLSNINYQQGRAVSHLDSADPFQVFTFTLPLKTEDQTAKLKVFYEKKQKPGSKKSFQISLLLTLDRLGDVRSDLTMLGKDLQVSFYVTKPAAMMAIQENFQELDELLRDLFDQIQLKVKVSAKRVKNFDQPEAQTAGNQRVDVRI
jgi:hypothetical protein